MSAPTGRPADDEFDVEFFVGLERQVWDALVAGDAEADRACLAEQFLGVYPSGFGDRSGHASQLADGPTVADYELLEPRLLRVAADHVMLAYRARYRRPDRSVPEEMYVSSLWSTVAGRWLNVFSQDTPAGGPDAVV